MELFDLNKNSFSEDLNTISIIPFSIFGQEKEINLFLNVQKVSQVLELGKLTPVPNSLKPFVGILDVDGIPIPVIDLSLAMYNPPEECDQLEKGTYLEQKKKNKNNRRIIICKMLDFQIGIIVDSTKKIRRQKNSDLLPVPDVWEKNKVFFVNGILKEASGFRYMLDLESFLANLGVEVGHLSENFVPIENKLKGKSLLIVEDSKLYQKLLTSLFTKYEIKYQLAINGVDGLKLLLDNSQKFDLALVDIEMPIMNGIEMVREYKKKCLSPIRILFHSSISNPNLTNDIKNEGLGEYITKFNETNILDTLEKFL